VQLQQSTGNRVRVSVPGRCGPKYESYLLALPRYTAPWCVGNGRPSRDRCCVASMVLYVVRDIASFEKSHSAYTYQIRTSSCETGSKGARQEAWRWLFLLHSPAQSWAGPAREPAYSQLPARPSVHIKRSSPLSCIFCTLRLLFLDLRVQETPDSSSSLTSPGENPVSRPPTQDPRKFDRVAGGEPFDGFRREVTS
jgi:hypothetical protein